MTRQHVACAPCIAWQLPGDRRRGVHRIASGGRAGRARRARARRRQPRHRQAAATSTHVAGVEFIQGDLADPAVARRAVERRRLRPAPGGHSRRCRARSPTRSRRHRANVDATLNVLVAARDAGVKRLVFAGSSSVYGDTPTLPKREDMPTDPLSPYALQKLVGEQYRQMFTRALRPRDGHHPVLQRVRSAPGSLVALLGRHLAVHRGAARRARRRRSTATASRRATSRTSPTSWTACCGVRGPGCGRPGHQRRDRRADLAEPSCSPV